MRHASSLPPRARHVDVAGASRLSEILSNVSKTHLPATQPLVGDGNRHAGVDSPGVALAAPAAPMLPLRKRPREEEGQVPRSSAPPATNQRLSVRDYLLTKSGPNVAR